MNIVLVTHRFLPRYFGGVETYTLQLAQALQGLGYTVQVLTGEPVSKADTSITVETDAVEGVRVTRLVYDFLRFPVISRAAYADPAFTIAIRSALAKFQPDLVHATSLSLLMGGAIEAAHQLGLPLIYTATDYVLTCRRGTYVRPNRSICTIKEEQTACTACLGPYTPLEKRLTWLWQHLPGSLRDPTLSLAETISGKHADFAQAADSIRHRLAYLPDWRNRISHIIAPSPYIRERLLQNGLSPDKITVLPHGLNSPPPHFKKLADTVLRFGYIGRLTYIKGVHLLLEAFAALPERLRQQARLTLYGAPDNQNEGYLRQLKKLSASLPQVKLAGRIDNQALSQVYQEIDYLVVPSVWPENCPVTILEAQAYQTPVIGSRVGGIPDLITHEVNGLLFEPDRPEQLAQRLEQCLSHPSLVQTLSANSHLIKSIAEETQLIVEIYRQVSSPGTFVPGS